MFENDRNKLNRVEELKSKLFSKNYKTTIERRDTFLHGDMEKVPESWETEAKEEPFSQNKFFMKTSIFKNFFIFSVVFLGLTLLYAGYVFFIGGNTVSNRNIDMAITGNAYTAGGDELSLIVGITNKNSTALELVDLITEYPKNAVNPGDSTSGTERFRQSLGTIPAGAIRNENIKVVLFGEQGSIVPIKISIEYRVEGSNAIFIKDIVHEVTISSTPLNLSIDAPDSITPNQEISLKVKATLNATKSVSNMLLRVDYPVGFQFVSANPSPTLGNNAWVLGDIAPGAVRDIVITGKMYDVFDGEEKIFRASSGSQSAKDKSLIDVVFNSISHSMLIKNPFISTQMYVNGVYQKEYSVNTNGVVHGEIHWTNNLDTSVEDFVVQAHLGGNALDRKSVNAQQGFYNSGTDTITWDRNSQSQFKEIGPGASGVVVFSVSPSSVYSSAGGLLADPVIDVDISVTGKQSLAGYETEQLKNFESKTIKVISDVGFNAKALYYGGPFTNTGAIPPKVEKETTYTITWSLSNSANSISKASVVSSLPSWVKFIGTSSPAFEDLNYNASTRELVWNVGRIQKGASITGAPKTVSFQVGFTPSLSQRGTVPVIINDATLTGHDDFANVDIRVSKSPLRTSLEGDTALPSGGGVVAE